MLIRELRPADFAAEWPRLQKLVGIDEGGSREKRILELLGGERAYALVVEQAGKPAGLAVTEHYQSAWIFDDRVASIRECVTSDEAARTELLAEIDLRARAANMTHLQRFLTADDEDLAWWYARGFIEYMTAFRKPLDIESVRCVSAQEGISIRAVSDAEADWPKLWPLFDRLDAHHADLTQRPLNADRENNARRYLEREVADDEALVMVAEVDGRAVATSTAELGQRDADGMRIGYRSRLYVEKAYRRLGLSVRFEARALSWFRDHGVTHVERWIVAGNERPRQIWSTRGYEPARILLRKALQA